MEITEKLRGLQAGISRAAQASNRTPDCVTVVAVSKGHSIAALQAAWTAGLRQFGENYVQEALPKIAALDDGPTWHFIGRLQANKTRAIAEGFHWAHTLTTTHIAERLSRQRPRYAADLQVCIQLSPRRTAVETAARSGVDATDVLNLARAVRALPRLRLRGIMFMPAADLELAALEAEFNRARGIFTSLRQEWPDLDTLSMGMSGDFAEAIAAGSTLIRIGTGIFGPRATAQ